MEDIPPPKDYHFPRGTFGWESNASHYEWLMSREDALNHREMALKDLVGAVVSNKKQQVGYFKDQKHTEQMLFPAPTHDGFFRIDPTNDESEVFKKINVADHYLRGGGGTASGAGLE